MKTENEERKEGRKRRQTELRKGNIKRENRKQDNTNAKKNEGITNAGRR